MASMVPFASAQLRARLLRPATPSQTVSIPGPMPHDPPPPYDSHLCNVVIFGETGTGKSSVVNLIAGGNVAETSPDAGACTFASKPHHVVLQNNRPFCVWDTVGLNEPEILEAEYLGAIKQAYKLIKELERSGGVHLLLLCTRGRITQSVQQNYRLFVKVFCETEVPFGVVVTNLENESCMEGWWGANKEVFERYDISSDGHACITASPGIGGVFFERYEESRGKIRELLLELTLSHGKGWKREKQKWLINLSGKMTKMFKEGRSTSLTQKALKGKLVKGCGFSEREAGSIAAAIIEIRDQTPVEVR